MNVIRWFLIISLLIAIESMPINANEVLKDDWINGVTTALPAALCKSDQLFRQCFSVTQEECEEVALSSTRVCIKNNREKIPPRLNQPEDGRYWGQIIGSCVGSAYVIALKNKKINNDKCNNWK